MDSTFRSRSSLSPLYLVSDIYLAADDGEGAETNQTLNHLEGLSVHARVWEKYCLFL